VCVVELEGSRVLVPACSRKVEPKMAIRTDSERVRLSRKMVLEFLASSVDLSLASPDVRRWMEGYGADPSRYGPPAAASGDGGRDAMMPGHHHLSEEGAAATVAQSVKVDNGLYVRDYSRCILCYKCVQACGVEAQNTFAIAVGRPRLRRAHLDGVRDAAARVGVRLLRQLHRRLPHGRAHVRERVRPRRAGKWDESRQTVTDTICPYCGVGCTSSSACRTTRSSASPRPSITT
jgi:predicted molibdopterin-dependent oxidoreductase YjgC